jgi:DNA-binding transcriptional regulator YdaS (Cro superfamily)
MDLYDYFFKLKKETGIEVKEFADQCGLCHSYMSSLIHARRHVSFPTAMRIEKVTNGKVTAVELMQLRANSVKSPINRTQSKKNPFVQKRRKGKKEKEEQLEFRTNK